MKRLVTGVGMMALLVAGCATGNTAVDVAEQTVHGTLAGSFQMTGGPVTPSGKLAMGPRPLSGVVTVKDSSGHTVDVTVGASGKFSVRLAPGIYAVAGQSPQIESMGPNGTASLLPCAMLNATSVQAGQTDRITLTCTVP